MFVCSVVLLCNILPFCFLSPLQGGLAEMTWVIADHMAAPGSSELSVTKGQQVEIVDMSCSGAPEYCLVRLSINASDSSEGLVPVAVLKPLPSSHSKLSSKQRDSDTLGGKH